MSPFQVRGSGVADAAEFRLALGDAIRALAPEQRRVLRLWFIGYAQQEIAELVGVNQSNVSRGLKQAFGELRQELQGLRPAVSTMEMPPELVDVVLEATAENGDD